MTFTNIAFSQKNDDVKFSLKNPQESSKPTPYEEELMEFQKDVWRKLISIFKR